MLSILQAQGEHAWTNKTWNPPWKMGAHTVWNVEKQELVPCDFCPIHISWWVWLFLWCLWTTYYCGRILLQIQISCLRALSCADRHVEFFINLSKTWYLCWGWRKNIWENWFFCKEITPYHSDPSNEFQMHLGNLVILAASYRWVWLKWVE